ncbi:MAG: Transposase and inactivated derivatives [uncultured Paraburkholderia sp.]|uniref:IS66 family insertion sequence element accessory protein TnpB n=1 Tax=uncultured Paraburkholderia sp. TaxID=1822466 RepID=UPI0033875DC3|nr:MAG: Transposase and inactivated derivatives [uncultured Paraburkholderia sp.]CAH2943722.1 MAG: Transposase and inactivated derivatives [uncultured Paraburkholderia sp.]
MISLPVGTRIWIAAGVTDMRCGFQGLAAKVQTALEENPLGGNVYIFRGRRGDLIKILWASITTYFMQGSGLCCLQNVMHLHIFAHRRAVLPVRFD